MSAMPISAHGRYDAAIQLRRMLQFSAEGEENHEAAGSHRPHRKCGDSAVRPGAYRAERRSPDAPINLGR